MGSAVQYIVLVTLAISCSLFEARHINLRRRVACPSIESCTKKCDFGFMRDNNCTLCACKQNPNAVECPAIHCPDDDCADGYQDDEHGCTTCECKSTVSIDSLSRRQARSQTCGPVCLMYCAYGNKLDDNGCPLCECKTKEETCGARRCRNYCPAGYKEDDKGCDTCECQSSSGSSSSRRGSSGSSSRRRGNSRSSSSSSRKRCNERIQCAMYCPNGFKRDEHGCEICECQESAGHQPSSRIIESSSGVGTSGDRNNDRSDTAGGTRVSCPRRRCTRRCPHGFVKDTFGCDTCNCNSRSRSHVTRPGPQCSSISCANHCPFGRQRGSDGCDSCTCNEPSTTPPKVCITCRMHCEHGFVEKPDGCFECKCKPAPAATPPTCIMCTMYCEHGFKTRPDGCDDCVCNDPPQ